MLNIFADTVCSTADLEKQIDKKDDSGIKRTYEILMDMKISRMYLVEKMIQKLESDK